jgi:hypothetical protein
MLHGDFLLDEPKVIQFGVGQKAGRKQAEISQRQRQRQRDTVNNSLLRQKPLLATAVFRLVQYLPGAHIPSHKHPQIKQIKRWNIAITSGVKAHVNHIGALSLGYIKLHDT